MQSAARAKFHVYRGNVSIFGPLSKNNTGMTALGADLPVIIQKFTVRPGGGTVALSPRPWIRHCVLVLIASERCDVSCRRHFFMLCFIMLCVLCFIKSPPQSAGFTKWWCPFVRPSSTRTCRPLVVLWSCSVAFLPRPLTITLVRAWYEWHLTWTGNFTLSGEWSPWVRQLPDLLMAAEAYRIDHWVRTDLMGILHVDGFKQSVFLAWPTAGVITRACIQYVHNGS